MATALDTMSKKPYPEFRLFAHQNGQWGRKIKGKLWFFGVWANPDAALRKYLDEVDEIQAGRDPRKTGVVHLPSNELTVAELCNLFLERREGRAKSGEITKRHFSDCLKSLRRLVDHLGKFFGATSMRAANFKAYCALFPDTWGPSIIISSDAQRQRKSVEQVATGNSESVRSVIGVDCQMSIE